MPIAIRSFHAVREVHAVLLLCLFVVGGFVGGGHGVVVEGLDEGADTPLDLVVGDLAGFASCDV